MSILFKRLMRWAGSALGLAGTIFVALRLNDYAAKIDLSRFGPGSWGAVLGLTGVYGAANMLLALAWRDLLMFFGSVTARGWAVRAYGVSQLAKYIPGNIFHLAGRQALGLYAGLPGWTLAKSALWELGLISATGAMLGVLALPLVLPILPVPLSMIVFAGIVTIVAIAVRRWLGSAVWRAFGWQASFLAISGGVFVGMLVLVTPQSVDPAMVPALCGAYILAWLAGLLTPGAPAGVGVRELMLLFLLGGKVPEADLLLAVLLGRIVSVGGDLGFFAFASLMNFRKESNAGC